MTSDMVGLKEIADELRAMREQFLRMGDGSVNVLDYIQYADLQSCKTIVDALVERVSTLVGCATELEDASCALQFEIEYAANPCPPHCSCDNCVAARSDEHHDRKHDGVRGWESVLSGLA